MKQLMIFCLLSVFFLSSFSQKIASIKLTAPCTQEMIDNVKGSWISPQMKITNEEQRNRLQEIVNLFIKTYPDPVGSVIAPNGGYSKVHFAEKLRLEKNENQMVYWMPVNENLVNRLDVHVIAYPYYCKNSSEIVNLYPEISGGVGAGVTANNLSIATTPNINDNELLINGRPMRLRMPVYRSWKGLDVFCTERMPGITPSNQFVLIHREGELPYVPVTRKEYLEHAIRYLNKFYDDQVRAIDTLGDNELSKADKDEYKKGIAKDKTEALGRYYDALQKSTTENLLETPAVVRGIFVIVDGPIFITEEEGGGMVVTENPKYMRTNISKYTPQFFVLTWSADSKLTYSQKFFEAFENNFPVEKLQAMIDK